MEYPIGFDFEDAYMNAESAGEFFNLTHGSVANASNASAANVLIPGGGNPTAANSGGDGGGVGGSGGRSTTMVQQSPSPVGGCFVADNATSAADRSNQTGSKLDTLGRMTVADGSSLCSAPLFASGISPIDPDLQERIKLERKRARNRIAATKCRRRKIEKINELEGRVREVTEHNQSLAQRVSSLRAEVTRLRHTVLKHRMNGCQFRDDLVCAETGKKKPMSTAGA